MSEVEYIFVIDEPDGVGVGLEMREGQRNVETEKQRE